MMKKLYVLLCISLAILLISGPILCTQQIDTTQAKQQLISPTPQSKQAEKQTKESKKFWTRTKMVFAGITTAAVVTFAAWLGKSKLEEMWDPYAAFERDLYKVEGKEEEARFREKWKPIIESDRGKKIIQTYHSKQIEKENEKNREYNKYAEVLNKLNTLEEAEALKLKPQWQKIAETKRGKSEFNIWYSLKLNQLVIDIFKIDEEKRKVSGPYYGLQGLENRYHEELFEPFNSPASINMLNSTTPLIETIRADMPLMIIQRMIELGADVTKQDDLGRTPLERTQARIRIYDEYLPNVTSSEERRMVLLKIQNLENIEKLLTHYLELKERKNK